MTDTAKPTRRDPERHATELLKASAALVEASSLVETAAGYLNTQSKTCGECGTAHYDSFDEFTQGRDLRAFAKKLRQRGRQIEELAAVSREKSS